MMRKWSSFVEKKCRSGGSYGFPQSRRTFSSSASGGEGLYWFPPLALISTLTGIAGYMIWQMLTQNNKKIRKMSEEFHHLHKVFREKYNEYEKLGKTQGDGSNVVTQAEINDVLEQIPKVRGHGGCMSPSYTSDSLGQESLEEEIKTLKKCQLENDTKIKSQDAHIQYLMQCNKLFLAKFPDIRPLIPSSTPEVEDDETHE